jgi:hypothetical protein
MSDDRMQVAFDDADPVAVDDEWLTEMERLERHSRNEARVRGRMLTSPHQVLSPLQTLLSH